MAISGKFLADFESFYTACQKAEVSLNSFETGGSKVEKSLNRLSNAFTGQRTIQDATLMTEAIGRIGGASTLTEREQGRVNAVVTEAIAKYKALGQEAPAAMRALAEATTRVSEATAATTQAVQVQQSSFAGLAQQVVGLVTLGKLVQFGRDVLQAGDAIQKMSDQTGLATDEVQKLQFIASQSGSSVESLVGAVQNLQQRLGDDSTGAAGAMARLGIHAAAFNQLGTYDQMITLAEAIRSLPSPTDQASTAAQLFGKTWKEILPAIKSGMVDVGNQAPIMSRAAVKALDDTGDALARAHLQAMAWAGGMASGIEKVGYGIGQFISLFDSSHFGLTNDAMLTLEGHLNDPDGLKAAFASIRPPILAMGDAIKATVTSAEDLKRIEDDLTATGKALTAIDEKNAALQDHLFGRDLTARAAEYAKALGGIENIAKLTEPVEDELNAVMGRAYDAFVKAGQGASAAAQQVMALRDASSRLTTLPGTSVPLKDLTAIPAPPAAAAAFDLGAFDAETKRLNDEIATMFGQAIPAAIKDPAIADAARASAESMGGPFIATFNQISQSADAAMAHVTSVIGALVQTDAYKAITGVIAPGFGTAERINRESLTNIGLTRPGIGTGGLGGGINLTINAQGGSYDTPAGQQQFYQKVSGAVETALKRAGVRF